MFQSSDVLDSQAITIAVDVVINSNSIGIHDDNIEKDLRDAHFELSFLLLDMNSLNSQDLESNENFDTERKTICETQQFNYTNLIHSNIVSSMIANCTSNLGILQREKLHEICLKNRCCLSVLSNINKNIDLSGIAVANIGEHNLLSKLGYGFAYINYKPCL
ncbi:41717_t:CDS:2, partial [Gigaspora margarita]